MRPPVASTDSSEAANRKGRAARFTLFLSLSGMLALAGCAERRGEVSGKATVDGKPLTTNAATLLFAPDKDNPIKKLPYAELDEHGRYHANTGDKEGVPLGRYKVYVAFDARVSKGKPPPFHARYLDAATSPLAIEVVANPQPGAYDLKLTEK